MSRNLTVSAIVVLLALALVMPAATSSAAPATIEDYASYQPQTKCSPKAKPGTKILAHWMVRKYGGGYGPISRRCSGGTSEHQEGRAFDWTLDATKKADRKLAESFMERVFRQDGQGNTDAWARRMGSCTSSGATPCIPPGTASGRSPTSARAARRRGGAPPRCGTETTCTFR